MHVPDRRGEPVITESQSALLHFTTAAFGPGEKKTAWHDVYGRTIAKVDLEPPRNGELMVEARLRNLPGLGLVSMASTELRFHKTRRLIDNDDLIMTIVDAGCWNGSQRGRELDLREGDAVVSTAGEVAAGTAFGRRVLLRVPTKAIAPVVGDLGALFMRRIPREAEALRLLRQYVRGVQEMDLGTPDLQRLTVSHIYDLVALTLEATGDVAKAAESRGAGAARLCAVKEDIVRNLEHGDVSVDAIAARHRISPRYLRKLFEREDLTFSEYVLDQRLALAHRLLSDPRHANDKIASIAFAAGFGDVSYFYRVFRRRYDLLPTDVRERASRVN